MTKIKVKEAGAPLSSAKERDAGFCSHIKDVGKIRKGRGDECQMCR
jgi:hypothetical protein